MASDRVDRSEHEKEFAAYTDIIREMDSAYAQARVERVAVSAMVGMYEMLPPEGHLFVFLSIFNKNVLLTVPENTLNGPREPSAYRVTDEMATAAIKDIRYTVAPSGKSVICEILLDNDYLVTGVSSVVDATAFVFELGRQAAYRKARDKVYEVLSFRVQERLSEARRGVGIRTA